MKSMLVLVASSYNKSFCYFWYCCIPNNLGASGHDNQVDLILNFTVLEYLSHHPETQTHLSPLPDLFLLGMAHSAEERIPQIQDIW